MQLHKTAETCTCTKYIHAASTMSYCHAHTCNHTHNYQLLDYKAEKV